MFKPARLLKIRIQFAIILAGVPLALATGAPSWANTNMAIIGDAGKTTSSSKNVRDSIARVGAKQLVLPGDNLYAGTYQSVWSPWSSAGFTFDVTAIGNHNQSYRQEIAYFAMPGEYYSKVIDGARFLVLNSDNDSTGPEQAAWLDGELRNARERLIFLVYHHPSYTISTFHRWEEKASFQRAIRPVIWAHRAKLTALIVGHDHIATLLHFNDLPVIVSGAVHEQRRDRGVDYVSDGVAIKTAWYFDLSPYWAHLSYKTGSAEAQFEFIRATENKATCTFSIRTGSAASLQSNCASSTFADEGLIAMPEKFFEVSPGIYRSAQPTTQDMRDLKAFGIKTVLDLNDDPDAIAEESKAAMTVGIQFVSHPMSGFWKPKDAQVDASLALLKNSANYPVLLHCQHGEDRTGLIVGLHRVEAEGWEPAKAYEEMLDRGFHKMLFFLNSYFKDRTGFDDIHPQDRGQSLI